MKSSNSALRLAAVSRLSPYMRPAKFRNSEPVSRPKRAMPSGTTPICRFTSTGFFCRSKPRISMRPELGASRPVSILMVVDFPAPLGPRNPKNCPGATRRFTSSTATRPPNRRVRCSVEIAAALMEFSTLAHTQKCVNARSLARVDRRRRNGGCLWKHCENRGKFEAERAATFGAIKSSDAAAVFLHHAVADAQTEAGAFADGLGGVEGIENFFGLFHARAGIGKLDDDRSLFTQSA